jgi:hypothetical protein
MEECASVGCNEARVVMADGVMRRLDVVVRTKRASGTFVGRIAETYVKRPDVVVLDGTGMHIVEGDVHPAKVVSRTLVIAMLRALQTEEAMHCKIAQRPNRLGKNECFQISRVGGTIGEAE